MADLTSHPMWNALLKWSLQYQDSSDAPPAGTESKSNKSNAQPRRQLTDADRKFLEAAMNSMLVDEVALMKMHVCVLRLPDTVNDVSSVLETMKSIQQLGTEALNGNEDAADAYGATAVTADIDTCIQDPADLANLIRQRKEVALEALDDLVLTIDMAINLYKVGGFDPLFDCLESKHDGIQWRAAGVIATVVQNNPKTQSWALEHGIIHKLLPNVRVGHKTPKVVAKSILALSSLIRSNQHAEEEFAKLGGFVRLLQVFVDETSAVAVRKYAYLCWCLCLCWCWCFSMC
jgi:Nucleotide exchange factor Fes1